MNPIIIDVNADELGDSATEADVARYCLMLADSLGDDGAVRWSGDDAIGVVFYGDDSDTIGPARERAWSRFLAG